MEKSAYSKSFTLLLTLLFFVSCVNDDQGGDDCSTNKDLSSDSFIKVNKSGCSPDPVDIPPAQTGGDFDEISKHIIDTVDDRNNNDELNKLRVEESFSRGDACHEKLENNQRFSDGIAYFITELSRKQKVQVQGIASYYGMASEDTNYFPVSLMSHPFCRVTESSLSKTLKKIPGANTIALAQRFSDDYNKYREKSLKGDSKALLDLQKLWGTFFGCLSYTESLSTADTSKSQKVADKYAPPGYRKPAGVKFYEDPSQSESSRLNIGMFQFTPNYSGNINACIRQWNKDYSSCKVNRGDRGDMISLVGSSLQHFNSYCGIHKFLQTFAVQVNSKKTRNTHPDNVLNGSLKSSAKRCVTPHFYSGWAYNHFGPVQNSTGKNLNKLLSCIYR